MNPDVETACEAIKSESWRLFALGRPLDLADVREIVQRAVARLTFERDEYKRAAEIAIRAGEKAVEVGTKLAVEMVVATGRQPCTCIGTCRGAEGLGPGWFCVLQPTEAKLITG